MNHKAILILAACAVLAATSPSCTRHSDHGHEAHEHSHSHEAHDHEAEGDEHDNEHEAPGGDADEITLKPSMAERFGVRADTVRAGEFHEVLEVSGRIEASPESQAVVTAPRAGQVKFASGVTQGKNVAAGSRIAYVSPQGVAGGDSNAAAKAALDAAKAEMERLRPLHDDGIVSTKDYNAAVAAYRAAAAAYSPGADAGWATAPAAGMVTQLLVSQGQYVNAGEPLAAINGSSRMIVRADVPEKYFREVQSFRNAKLRLPYTDQVIDIAAAGGSRVNPSALAVTVNPGYIPIYFSLPAAEAAISGGYTQVYLEGAPRQGVITLPAVAISEQQGNHYVYQRLDEDCYRKLAVNLGASDGQSVEITQGVETGMVIVTAGTTAVRLAETQAVAPEGHSHNH